MTPEEEFNQEIWWILQEIRKEQLATLKGEKVKFKIRYHSGIPSIERQKKLLHILQAKGVLSELEIKDDVSDYDLFDKSIKCFFILNQPKFDEFYKKWGEIDENPWFSKNGKIARAEKLLKGKQKQPAVKEIYSNINYSDKAEGNGWEKKWDILQTIWSFYHSNNKENENGVIHARTLEQKEVVDLRSLS